MTTSTAKHATVAILSIGDMGLGIARLLKANHYNVSTNVSDRSKATQDRARMNGIELVGNDIDLCSAADYILSIVPQRDALSVVDRIIAATTSSKAPPRSDPLHVLELNAVSPGTAQKTAELFARSAPDIRLIDGGIISSPPKLKDDGTWSRPCLIVSGPIDLHKQSSRDQHLAQTLNMRQINHKIGSASALKMCFASMNKGFAAIATQSFTAAQKYDVVPDLQNLLSEFAPALGGVANRGVPTMPPKAYRWVQEMREIADTFEHEAGFHPEESIFRPIAEFYDFVTNGTELGNEKTDDRQRGKTVEDVAKFMLEGTDRRSSAS